MASGSNATAHDAMVRGVDVISRENAPCGISTWAPPSTGGADACRSLEHALATLLAMLRSRLVALLASVGVVSASCGAPNEDRISAYEGTWRVEPKEAERLARVNARIALDEIEKARKSWQERKPDPV